VLVLAAMPTAFGARGWPWLMSGLFALLVIATFRMASLLTEGAPDAMLALSAAAPPAVKSLRQRRTVSSRTPNASAILGLVQPASVSSTARARSASPRPREPGKAARSVVHRSP
jgi:hypothetical protein